MYTSTLHDKALNSNECITNFCGRNRSEEVPQAVIQSGAKVLRKIATSVYTLRIYPNDVTAGTYKEDRNLSSCLIYLSAVLLQFWYPMQTIFKIM